MKILVIGGLGTWGRNHVRTLSCFKNIKVETATRQNWKELISRKPSGVIICTGPEQHVEIALEAVRHAVPVLIEKPVSLNLVAARQLNDAVTKANFSPVLVNNIHLFSPAYEKLVELVRLSGPVTRIFSMGSNWGPFRDYSSLYDYGPHDISMCLYLLNETPRIYATSVRNIKLPHPFWHGAKVITDERPQLFGFGLGFKDCKARVQVGNGSIKKFRYFEVRTQDDTIIYDDTAAEKLTLNGRAVMIVNTNPLESVLDRFIMSINGYRDDRFGMELNLKVMETLQTIEDKIG